jgi:hypothetical protein
MSLSNQSVSLRASPLYTLIYVSSKSYAIAQAVSRWLPTVTARVRARGQVMWDLWWTKWHRGTFSPSTSISPANLHSTNCSTITIIWGWCNRPVVAAVPSGVSLTPPRIIIINRN